MIGSSLFAWGPEPEDDDEDDERVSLLLSPPGVVLAVLNPCIELVPDISLFDAPAWAVLVCSPKLDVSGCADCFV